MGRCSGNVSWLDCKAYADWAERLLPTEAQWEYAARGGLEGKEYPWGNEEPKDQLWWTPTSGDKGTACGKLPLAHYSKVFLAYRKRIRGTFPRTSALYRSLP